MRTEEMASRSTIEKTEMDRSLVRLEENSTDMQQQIQALQAQLAEAEQHHAQRYCHYFKKTYIYILFLTKQEILNNIKKIYKQK